MKLTERAQQTGSQLPPKLVARAAYLIAAKPNRCQASPALRSVQRGKNIHTHHYFSYGLRFLRKSRFESRVAARAMPEMANDLVIQEFCPMRGNNLVVAPNALYAKHEHRASFRNHSWSLPFDPKDRGLACDPKKYVTITSLDSPFAEVTSKSRGTAVPLIASMALRIRFIITC